MRTTLRFAGAFALVLASIACGPRTVIVQAAPPPPPPFQRIVVAALPLENTTADMEASQMLRNQLVGRVAGKGYLLQAPQDTDERLRGMGISLGGQVKGTNPKEFAKIGADAVLTGTILQASSIITGVYNRRTIEAEMVLTDVRTGTAIWTLRHKIYVEEAPKVRTGLDALVSVAHAAEKSNLSREAAALANVLVNDMPWCPREGDVAWNGQLLPAATVAAPAPAPAPAH